MLFTPENILLAGSILLLSVYWLERPAIVLVSLLYYYFSSRYAFRKRRIGYSILQYEGSSIHRHGRPQHHPVYWWYGYQIQRHQAGTSSWYHAFNGRRTFYHFIYRPFYLVAFRYELDQYPFFAHPIIIAGGHHVVYRFRFRLFHSEITKDQFEVQFTTYARTRKRK